MKEMKEYLLHFMNKLDFPREAKKVFLDVNGIINANVNYKEEMDSIISKFYYNSGHNKPKEILEELTHLSQKMNINPYTMHLMFYMYCSRVLLDKYKESGVSLDIFWNSMFDLRYKLQECHVVYGVWGTFVGEWFPGFFTMERYGLGRLQYERIPFSYDKYIRNGHVVQKGDRVYNMHIPSAGPLTRDKRMDSYRRAYEFFKDELEGAPLVVVCHSWLLYPDNEKFYPKNSNIVDFMHDFEIIDSQDQDSFTDTWRVFGRDHDKAVDELPTDTSLQRAYIDWLKAGNKTGGGFGILLFDGQRIL
mgnify:CR=1 FL=1